MRNIRLMFSICILPQYFQKSKPRKAREILERDEWGRIVKSKVQALAN